MDRLPLPGFDLAIFEPASVEKRLCLYSLGHLALFIYHIRKFTHIVSFMYRFRIVATFKKCFTFVQNYKHYKYTGEEFDIHFCQNKIGWFKVIFESIWRNLNQWFSTSLQVIIVIFSYFQKKNKILKSLFILHIKF